MEKLTVQKLYTDLDFYSKKDDENYLLNQDPPKAWVKVHPFIKSHKYLPIDKIEYLLKRIFKEYSIEILREGTSFNGVYVVVRLHYKSLADGKMKFYDGIGACPLQTKSGKSPADLANISNGAISMAYPIAETLAIKDAADKLGRLFGSDLNRSDLIPTTRDSRILTDSEKLELIKEKFNKVQAGDFPEETIMNIERIIDTKEVESYDKLINIL